MHKKTSGTYIHGHSGSAPRLQKAAKFSSGKKQLSSKAVLTE